MMCWILSVVFSAWIVLAGVWPRIAACTGARIVFGWRHSSTMMSVGSRLIAAQMAEPDCIRDRASGTDLRYQV